MAPIFTEIQSPEKDAANLRAELDSLYRDLCRLFLSHPEPTLVSDDRTLLEGVLAARRGEQAVRTRLEGMQLALNDISEATPAISKARSWWDMALPMPERVNLSADSKYMSVFMPLV